MTDLISTMPKVELHTHIDTSIAFDTAKLLRPDMDHDAYLETLVAPEKCKDLVEFLSCIEPALEMLQTDTALKIVVDDLVRQIAADNVLYAEMRFAPHLHRRKGMRLEEVVETTLSQMHESASREGIDCGLILCTLRHFTEAQGLEVVDLITRYQDQGVVSLDLAADEANFPIEPHIAVFRRARELGLNVIAHAGEAKGPESVMETMDKLQVSRIGHGVRSIEDLDTLERVVEQGVHLEVCPSCNVQTDIFTSLSDHSIGKLREAGANLSINTDARGTANVSLNEEYARIGDVFGWSASELLPFSKMALDASFAPANVRAKVQERLDQFAALAG